MKSNKKQNKGEMRASVEGQEIGETGRSGDGAGKPRADGQEVGESSDRDHRTGGSSKVTRIVKRISSEVDLELEQEGLPNPHLSGMDIVLDSAMSEMDSMAGSPRPDSRMVRHLSRLGDRVIDPIGSRPQSVGGDISDASSCQSRNTPGEFKRRLPSSGKETSGKRARGSLGANYLRKVGIVSDDSDIELEEPNFESMKVHELAGEISNSIIEVLDVAATSGNLKGTYVKTLKLAAVRIGKTTRELSRRACAVRGQGPSVEEADELNRVISRQRSRIAQLENELSEAKTGREVSPSKGHSSRSGSELGRSRERYKRKSRTEDTDEQRVLDLERRILNRIDKLIDSRLGALEEGIRLITGAGKPGGSLVPPKKGNTNGRRTPVGVSVSGRPNLVSASASVESLVASSGPEVDPGNKKKRLVKKRNALALTDGGRAGMPDSDYRNRDTEADSGKEIPWSQVIGRKEKAASRAAALKSTMPNKATVISQEISRATRQPGAGRLPTSAAVTITIPEGDDRTSYAEVMLAARSKIDLKELGIENIRPKRAVTGGLILEIPGPESSRKADNLASRLSEVLVDKGVRVARPIKRSEMRLSGLDDSVTPDEIRKVIAKVGDCCVSQVRVGEIRMSFSGLGAVWAQCPRAAAIALEKLGVLQIGWSMAKVDFYAPRPLQCFQCLELGHVGSKCTSGTVRRDRCFRCGDASHKAADCRADPKCFVCENVGRPSNHRLGSTVCVASRRRAAGRANNSGGLMAPPAPKGLGSGPATTVGITSVGRSANMTAAPAGLGSGPVAVSVAMNKKNSRGAGTISSGPTIVEDRPVSVALRFEKADHNSRSGSESRKERSSSSSRREKEKTPVFTFREDAPAEVVTESMQ